jgi:hypothetical protein
MANKLPILPNVTVDIYRNSNPNNPIPGGVPAVAAVPGYIKPAMTTGRHGTAQWLKWTHVVVLPPGTDIRDAYNTQLDPSRSNNSADTVILTDSAGNKVPYYVVFAEDVFRGTPLAQVRAYLDRFQPQQWPSDGI